MNEKMRQRLEIDVPWYLPAGGVLSACLLALVYLTGLNLDLTDLGRSEQIESFTLRLLWGASSLGLNMVMLWCTGVLLYTFRFLQNFLDLRPAKWLVLPTAALAFCAWRYLNYVFGTASDLLSQTVYARVEFVRYAATGNNWSGILLVVLFIAAACGILKVEKPSTQNESDRIFELVAFERLMRVLVLSAGALIGVALYEMHRLYAWAAVLAGGAIQADLEDLAAGLALGGGILFSTLLAVIFLPIAVKLAQWQTSLRRTKLQANPEINWAEWAKQHEIQSPLQAVSSYLGILLPTLSGLAMQSSSVP